VSAASPAAAGALAAWASRPALSRGRLHHEPPAPTRDDYQRDRDRIVHSKSFRRLKHKTQVFLAPEGDHYRTRLTHVLEVTQIGRTIAKSLRLNEVLTEAIGLGHDLGHSAFGHAGEAALSKLVRGGFDHYRQSVRVVEKLEDLNLTVEVRDGILKHSKGEKGELLRKRPKSRALTLEGDVIRISDIIAYVNHDIDDGIRAGIISENDIPKPIRDTLGQRASQRIDRCCQIPQPPGPALESAARPACRFRVEPDAPAAQVFRLFTVCKPHADHINGASPSLDDHIDCFFPGFYAERPCDIISASHRDHPDAHVKADGLPDQQLQSTVSSHRDESLGTAGEGSSNGFPKFFKRPTFSKLHSEISLRKLRSHLRNSASCFAAAGTRIRKNHSAHSVFHKETSGVCRSRRVCHTPSRDTRRSVR